MPPEPSLPLDAALPSPSDAELFRAMQAGQPDALGVLYDRHAGLVYGLALQILNSAQEAEDLTQDVFLALAKGDTYDPARGSLRTFLAILTRSRALDRQRSYNRRREQWQQHVLPTLDDIDPHTPTDHASQTERSEEVKAALAQLPDSEQQVLRLAYYEGLSQAEIAQQLEVSLGTVKSRSRRGLLKLRQSLADFLGTP